MTVIATPTLRSLLRISDLDRAEFAALLDVAALMKRHPLTSLTALEGRALACYLAEPRDAVTGARAVYTDVWVSMGQEADAPERQAKFARFRVTPELMRLAAGDAIFLHCLPAHRGEEVDAAVIDGRQAMVWEQAANRLPTEQALLYALITGDWEA